jgi:hypothetical protein
MKLLIYPPPITSSLLGQEKNLVNKMNAQGEKAEGEEVKKKY